MKDNSLVSVIIPTYNRANTIRKAIESALFQTYRNCEIIVIDDGSTDETENIVFSINDNRLLYHKIVNSGANVARNTGLKKAKGEYIAFLDSDDEWLPDKISKQMELIMLHDVDVVYSGFVCINEKGESLRNVYPVEYQNFFVELIVSNYIGTLSTLIVKKSCLLEVGGFDESLPSCQDWDLYIRLAMHYRFKAVNALLVNYYESEMTVKISSSKKAVVLGHKMIKEKFRTEILGLSEKKNAERKDYVGRMLVSGGALKDGFLEIMSAFMIDKQWMVFLKSTLFFLKRIFIRMGL
jgi:glycosyltransferase involved in cell wall biosynthesis